MGCPGEKDAGAEASARRQSPKLIPVARAVSTSVVRRVDALWLAQRLLDRDATRCAATAAPPCAPTSRRRSREPPRRRIASRAAGRSPSAVRRAADDRAPASASPCPVIRWISRAIGSHSPPSRLASPGSDSPIIDTVPPLGNAPSATTTIEKCRPARSRASDLVAHLLEIVRDLGNQNHVGRAGERPSAAR